MPVKEPGPHEMRRNDHPSGGVLLECMTCDHHAIATDVRFVEAISERHRQVQTGI